MPLQVYDPAQEELKKRILAARAAGWNDQDINRFATQDMMTQQLMRQQQASSTTNAQASSPANQQAKGNWLQKMLPSIGGIGGGVAGGAAGGALAGTAVLPGIGTAAGGLLGALLGGAAGGATGKVVENRLEGQSAGSGVGKEALLNGLFAAGPLRLLKGAGVASKAVTAGNPLIDSLNAGGDAAKSMGFFRSINNARGNMANRVYSQAFTVPRRAAQTLKPQDVSQELRQYGISGSLENIGATSENVLKQLGGVFDKSVSGIGGEVKVGEPYKVLQDALHGVKISKPDYNALLQRVTDIGTGGKLPGFDSPSKILDTIRDLESRGYARISAANSALVKNPDMADLGSAYVQVAKELEDNLFGAVDRSGALSKLQTPETQQALNGLARGLGDKVLGAKSISEVRSLMSPFVRAKNLVRSSLDEMQAAGTKGLSGMATQGVGAGTGALIAGPAGAIAGLTLAPMLRGAEESVAAPIATNVGRIVGAGADRNAGREFNPFSVWNTTKRVAPVGVAQAGAPAIQQPGQQGQQQGNDLLSQLSSGTASAQGIPDMNAAAAAGNSGGVGGSGGPMVTGADGSQYPLSSFTPEVINQMLVNDISKTGGKNIDQIKNIVAIQQSMAPKAGKAAASPYGKPTAQQYALANAGAQTLQQIAGMIGTDPGVVTRTATPGQSLPVIGGLVQRGAGTGQFNALANNVIDSILRLRTGAQANKQEIEMYRRSLFPQAGDNPQTIQLKLQQLNAAFQPFLMHQGNDDPLSQLMQGGSDSGQSFDPFSQFNYAY